MRTQTQSSNPYHRQGLISLPYPFPEIMFRKIDKYVAGGICILGCNWSLDWCRSLDARQTDVEPDKGMMIAVLVKYKSHIFVQLDNVTRLL